MPLLKNKQIEVQPLQTATSVAASRPPVARLLGAWRSLAPGLRDGGEAALAGGVRRFAPQASIYRLSFIGCVVVPALLTQLYLAFVASDQFVAETRFAVRAQESDAGDALKSALSSLGSLSVPSMAGQDAFVITSYIHSGAIIDDLEKDADLRAIYRRPEADVWARLSARASKEELLSYWNDMVMTNVDGPSGIVTVKVRAFRPEDALTLANAVTARSEMLANATSQRARTDVMRRAEGEVRRAESQVREALADLRAYRDSVGYLNPLAAAESSSKLLLDSMAEKIQLESELFVASRSMSDSAPTLQGLKTRIQAVDASIERTKTQLTGANNPIAVSASLVQFETLEIRRTFAEKLYSLAQESLERARRKAEAQNIYVTTFVPPSLPQDARYPQRFALSVLIPLGLMIIWGIFALIAAAVEDHRQ